MKTLLSLLRTESVFLTLLHPIRQAQIASSTFSYLVRALLTPVIAEAEEDSTTAGWINDELKDEWKKSFDKYDDLRYHFLKEAAYVPSACSLPKVAPYTDFLLVSNEQCSRQVIYQSNYLISSQCSSPTSSCAQSPCHPRIPDNNADFRL